MNSEKKMIENGFVMFCMALHCMQLYVVCMYDYVCLCNIQYTIYTYTVYIYIILYNIIYIYIFVHTYENGLCVHAGILCIFVLKQYAQFLTLPGRACLPM